VYFKAHTAVKELDEHIPVDVILNDWADLILHFKSQSFTILVFDAYYTSRIGLDCLIKKGILFCGGVNSTRFPDQVRQTDVHRPGQHSMLYNTKTNEVFVTAW
jgi:hypothetical protein